MSPVKSPEEFNARDARNKDKIAVEKDDAKELPPGWTKEVRTRKTGSRTKVDRYYTDPVTGYIFFSLKDVQRYLKTGELGRLAIKPKTKPSELKEQTSETLSHKRAPTRKSESPARASKRLAGGNSDAPPPSLPLSPSPPEPKTCQATRLAGIKVDSPSLPQLPPEPKTRQATQLAGVMVDAAPPSPPEPKTRQARRLAGVTVDEPPLSPPEPKTRQAARQVGIKIDSPPLLPPDSKTLQATPVMGTETGTLAPSKPKPKTHQATPVMGTETGTSPSSKPELITSQATPVMGSETDTSLPSKPEPKARQAKRLAASPQPKTRRATRQAGIKIDSPPPSPPDTRTSRQPTRTRPVNSTTPKENNKKTEPEKPTDNRNQNADVDANINHNQENSIIPPPSNQESNKNQIQTTLEKQKSPVVNPTITNPVPQSDCSSINFSMNDLWTDPCIEFAVKTLTGAIPFTDLNKVENFTTAPPQAPIPDIWTDPCIEFAVKTLTGAIPVTEGDYLLHRPASSANPAGPYNFSSPMNVCQTGYNFSSPMNVCQTGYNKQQESVFPTLGNGGLQKPGKFVNGSSGQCSRSRFYQ